MKLYDMEMLTPAIKLWINDGQGNTVARVRLYILQNDLHRRNYGYVEDLFVDPSVRGQGLAKRLMAELIAKAKKLKCYKVVAGSRHSRPLVHKLYRDLGFTEHGIEFRMDLP
jgi:GNAT superfamily N-acetyltransferase